MPKETLFSIAKQYKITIDDLRKAIESLSQATEEFAARRMNANIRRALTGKNLSEIE